MLNDEQLHDRISDVIQRALTEMKCMVLRAQHLREDIAELQAHPTAEMVDAFCRNHERMQTS